MSYAKPAPGKRSSSVLPYAQLAVRTNIESASPHRLILLLLDGAVEKLHLAKLAMERNQIAEKGANISWAISIIDGLRASLNMDQGGNVASNLDNLYDYMGRRLVEANLSNDVAILDEILTLLNEIRSGWKGIEPLVEGKTPDVSNNVDATALAVG